MNDTISINPDLNLYILPTIGFVVSSFEEEVMIDNPIAASILFEVNKNVSSVSNLLSSFSTRYSPIQIMRLLQSLIAKKYLILEKRDENEKNSEELYSKLSEKVALLFDNPLKGNVSLSSIFFEKLILDKNNDCTVFATVSDNKLLIGPNHSIQNSICLNCFRSRIFSQRPLLKLVFENRSELSFVAGKVDIESRLNKLCMIMTKRSIKLDPTYFWQVDLDTGEISSYLPSAIGECENCNTVKKSKQKMVNEIAEISLTKGQAFRTSSLQATHDKLLPLVHSYVGIISKLVTYKELDSNLVCNYSSGRNLAFSSSNKFWLNNHLRSSSGGKGKTKLQAKVSALCEAVERYSMVHQGQKADLVVSFQTSDEQLIHPQSSLNFSDKQYANRDEINVNTCAFHQLVPKPFDETKLENWNKAYSLTNKRDCYILSDVAYAQYSGKPENELCAYPDSNGCASGNAYLEAILQGSFELIERDAVAIWWYNMCERQHVDISSIENEYISNVSQYYKSIGRAMHIIDITTDIEIPCFVAVTYNLSTGNEILYGFGCHIDPMIAIERSVTELNQLLPIAQTARSKSCDQTLYKWMDSEKISSHPYIDIRGVEGADFKSLYPRLESACLQTAIETVINNLSQQNIELIAFDLTQTDTNMPVVKMLAPGLRHFWRRTAPGRLYDVPVKMGWRENPLNENELNSHSITI